MGAELDHRWRILAYYDTGEVKLILCLGSEIENEICHLFYLKTDNSGHIFGGTRMVTRIHIIAPDHYPVRALDSASGNPFAATPQEKRAGRAMREPFWNRRGIFRRAHGGTRAERDSLRREEPGF